MILAGDIGGTKTVLGLFEPDGKSLRQTQEVVYHSRDHQSLEDILRDFTSSQNTRSLQAACFGVAGAVIDGRCQTTNLPWHLDERDLAQCLNEPKVKLLNDLEAASFGMLFLGPNELRALNPDARPNRQGNVAVIAAGTGLGEGMLYWDGTQYHPLASEGGHSDFAPRSDQEIELLRHLRHKFEGHASWERVLSGPGISNIYEFLRESSGPPEPAWLSDRMHQEDPNAVIAEVGLRNEDPICAETLSLFSHLYGAEAGNLALKCVATGGVYVGGGIAPHLLPILENGSFLRGFVEKGRFRALMQSIPVQVALNPRAPLLGAAHYALRL